MIDPAAEEETPELAAIWPVFGDLMACLFGLFVLFFVWAVAFQVDLAGDLEAERAARAEERARLETLEQALAGPLAEGRITLSGGRIGLRGSILFGVGSADLLPEGKALLGSIAPALQAYLANHDELIMVSGFTDDQAVAASARSFQDNWELSVQRALTVTRTLAAAGVPADGLFAAGFGETHPVAPNDTAENRAKNRRVEITPIPRRQAAGDGTETLPSLGAETLGGADGTLSGAGGTPRQGATEGVVETNGAPGKTNDTQRGSGGASKKTPAGGVGEGDAR
ncbi:OmpA family protein [Chondromyces crocatus]|uniref:OmpA-like domain-containing protein n=1 Tax=Chondromyces crocatus TaxID=52 RepID=A0A0K1E5K3_CHOCO|nr:OmpA family protein [Chondromyces crocatus]AKT35972.1 uncharacterized protein CMC5_000840 [Chondromyces crocatus]